MKILIITDYFRDQPLNGSEVFCAALVERLEQQHEIEVIARVAPEPSARQPSLLIDDATAGNQETLSEFIAQHLTLSAYDLVYNLGALIFGCNVVQALLAAAPDLCLVNHFQALLGPYARQEGLPEHLQLLNAAGQHHAAAKAALNIFLSQAEALVAISSGYPLAGSVTAVVPNGLPVAPFADVVADPWFLGENQHSLPRPLVIACAGRFADFTKGADLIYRAFAELRRDREDVFLLSIGNSSRFSSVLRALPSQSYRLVDWLPRPKFLATLAAADLVVVPSRYEPFGLIALEAQMLGVPVIANAVGGLAEIVHHDVSGLLSLPEDGSLGLYLAIKKLLENPERLGEMGRAGLKAARAEYDIERIAGWVDRHLRRAVRVGRPAAELV